MATNISKLHKQAVALERKATVSTAASELRLRVTQEALRVIGEVEGMTCAGKMELTFKVEILQKLAKVVAEVDPPKLAAAAPPLAMQFNFNGIPKSEMLRVRSVLDAARVSEDGK